MESNEDSMRFKLTATGTEYEYASHPASAEPFMQNLERYFGAACPRAKLDALTPDEREGVRLGGAFAGMSKEAVVLAMGYPPRRETPTLEKPMWTYWRSRARSFMIEFNPAGKVVQVYN